MVKPVWMSMLFAAFTAVACSPGSSELSALESCAALADCCASLSTESNLCSSVGMAAEDQCAEALTTLQQGGECGADAGRSGTTSGPASASTNAPSGGGAIPSACEAYIECMALADPSGQAEILAAYGPDGSCWQNGSTTSTCEAACTAALGEAPCSAGMDLKPAMAEPTCPSGMTPCDESCTDLGRDDANCGTCGNACGAGEACVAGKCACSGGEVLCGGSCTDTRYAADNCGACGNVCEGGEPCTAGVCGCGAGRTFCGGECLDTSSDVKNCGACGFACPTGSTGCHDGECLADPNVGRATCDVACPALGSGFACGSADFLFEPTSGCASSVVPATCGTSWQDTPPRPAESGDLCDGLWVLVCACSHS
jgi:hypothetical protein